MDESVLKEITIDDIENRDLRMIAELFGVEIAIKFWQRFQGITISVPMNALTKFQHEWIKRNSKDMFPKEMAIKIGFSERYVQQIMSDQKKTRQIEIRQSELFKEK